MKNDFQKNDKKVTPQQIVKKKREPQNCWEFYDCSEEAKEKCLVFQNDMGKECWFVCNIKEINNKNTEKFKNCFECDWYKKINDLA